MSSCVNILGTEYLIHHVDQTKDKYMVEHGLSGYVNSYTKEIFIANAVSIPNNDHLSSATWRVQEKDTLRHEILHAFLRESGLDASATHTFGPWPLNEEMIDWFAIQSPKIFKAYQDADAL